MEKQGAMTSKPPISELKAVLGLKAAMYLKLANSTQIFSAFL